MTHTLSHSHRHTPALFTRQQQYVCKAKFLNPVCLLNSEVFAVFVCFVWGRYSLVALGISVGGITSLVVRSQTAAQGGQGSYFWTTLWANQVLLS